MPVDMNPPPPDNQGGYLAFDDSGELATVMQVAARLLCAAVVLALIDVWLPLNLEPYFASILGAYGAYLLARWGGPEPPTGQLAA
ncbi:hypothetical protein ACF1A5_18805 [Streptomyces sp. NPDC014864]|uniref:hypothetical protein n=1 Tax=Streptomyces sp. NPDC014864 TaxID=3364924 RepID=UPI00370069A0